MEVTPFKFHTRTICANIHPQFTCSQIFYEVPIQNPIITITYGDKQKNADGIIHLDSLVFGHGRVVTIVFLIDDCNINMKAFETTGSVQLTGCRKIEVARTACEIFAKALSKNGTVSNFRLCGVKGGFSIGTEIDLVRLDHVLQGKYDLISSFDPNSSNHGFHGIKISLYWNEYRDGICHCEPNDEYDKCPCLHFTLTVFRTGSIGLMSSTATDRDIDEVYRFFSHIIMEHHDDISTKNIADYLVNTYKFKKLIYRNRKDRIVKIRTIIILNDNNVEHERSESCVPCGNS